MYELMDSPALQASAIRLIRCRTTHSYYTGEGWTENPMNAQPYPNEMEAVRACVSHDLHEVELVIRRFADGPDLFVTPIR